MCLKIDLTDAIPRIDHKHGIHAAAFHYTGGTSVGVYNPDEQMWGFMVRDRQIMVPELLDDSISLL